MYTVVPYSDTLDLAAFYKDAEARGFANNSSKKVMVDCFRNEPKKQTWMLYKDSIAMGSFAAHSFDDVMGPGSYRVLSRVCSFAEAAPRQGLLTLRKMMHEHRSLHDQIYLPVCIEWAGRENLYATSHPSDVASQRVVHQYYFPGLAEIGIMEKVKDVVYRNTYQTVWRINVDKFEANLAKFPRWQYVVSTTPWHQESS